MKLRHTEGVKRNAQRKIGARKISFEAWDQPLGTLFHTATNLVPNYNAFLFATETHVALADILY
jgi:hypothetical protein